MITALKPAIPIFDGAEITDFWERLDKRKEAFSPRVQSLVRTIVRDVARHGDKALLRYTRQFDGVRLQARQIRVLPSELRKQAALVDPVLRMDFEKAIFNITAFHRHQIQKSWDVEHDGVLLGQKATPLKSVGVYVPGGKAAYPSSVLMAAIPAKVAGVERIAVVTPPGTLRTNPSVAGALSLLGIREIYRVGGAQAIAALAYGTETIPPVDKVVGPGNAYVAAAKREVFGKVDIDMIAGPTEVLIVADESASPKFVAADLLSQAEHDESASAVCITDSRPHAALIQSEVARQLEQLPRQAIARKSLRKYGAILVLKTLGEATGIVNRFAPEHLELMVEEPSRFAAGVANAGAIFYGYHTPEAVGDYFAGPSHILPTCGTARFFSPLGVYDYLKFTSIIQYSEQRLRQCRDSIVRMATVEGLEGHARSASIRFEKKDKDDDNR